jgi:hypothetical protein
MPEFIDREVSRIRDSSSSEPITLLVGFDQDSDELIDAVENLDGNVEDQIGRSTLQISIPKSAVDQLCELDSAISIEPDKDDVYTQGAGENFEHRNDLMM